MKFNRWFTTCITAFIILIFFVQMKAPKHFSWEQTFSHHDLQPFGCALLDSMLTRSLPHGYSVSRKTPYQMEQDDTVNRKSIFIVGTGYHIPDTDMKALFDMAYRGDHILLAGDYFGSLLEDTLRFKTRNYYYLMNLNTLKQYATRMYPKDELIWCGDSSVYNTQKFHCYPPLCSGHFNLTDSTSCQILLFRQEEKTESDSIPKKKPVAITYTLGKGEITLASIPLLFTNYGLLDSNNHLLQLRLISHLAKYPVIRTECYTSPITGEQLSPLRYILSQPPLRWALYMILLGIILFILFTAKRKQRAIPVINPPKDHSLEFIKLIGTLYYQKKGHTDLVRKKFTYFTEQLRREAHIELSDGNDLDTQAEKIAGKTGMDPKCITEALRRIYPVVKGEKDTTENEMKQLINEMENITNHLI